VGQFMVKRSIEGLITLWLITLAVFFLLRLGGGNPIAYMLPPEATQADIDKLTKAYGFDRPLLYPIPSTCACDLKLSQVLDTLDNSQSFRESPCRLPSGDIDVQLRDSNSHPDSTHRR
jgi:hypothetical protein